jgi:flagellar hook assembly protein FlgD
VPLPAAGALRLDVYDARGRRVRQVHHGAVSAGRHAFAWDGTLAGGRKAPSGVYFAQATCDAGKAVRKLVLTE